MRRYRERANLLDELVEDDVEKNEEQGSTVASFRRCADVFPLQNCLRKKAARQARKSNKEEASPPESIH